MMARVHSAILRRAKFEYHPNTERTVQLARLGALAWIARLARNVRARVLRSGVIGTATTDIMDRVRRVNKHRAVEPSDEWAYWCSRRNVSSNTALAQPIGRRFC
jgi:hypothetical protein